MEPGTLAMRGLCYYKRSCNNFISMQNFWAGNVYKILENTVQLLKVAENYNSYNCKVCNVMHNEVMFHEIFVNKSEPVPQNRVLNASLENLVRKTRTKPSRENTPL